MAQQPPQQQNLSSSGSSSSLQVLYKSVNCSFERYPWFDATATRDYAINLIYPMGPGAFLVRPSSKENSLALSVKTAEGPVTHLLIDWTRDNSGDHFVLGGEPPNTQNFGVGSPATFIKHGKSLETIIQSAFYLDPHSRLAKPILTSRDGYPYWFFTPWIHEESNFDETVARKMLDTKLADHYVVVWRPYGLSVFEKKGNTNIILEARGRPVNKQALTGEWRFEPVEHAPGETGSKGRGTEIVDERNSSLPPPVITMELLTYFTELHRKGKKPLEREGDSKPNIATWKLMWSLDNPNFELIKRLVEGEGASLKYKSKELTTPLSLLLHNSNVTSDENGLINFFNWVIDSGRMDALNVTFKASKEKYSLVDWNGAETSVGNILAICVAGGYFNLAKSLVEKGVFVDAVSLVQVAKKRKVSLLKTCISKSSSLTLSMHALQILMNALLGMGKLNDGNNRIDSTPENDYELIKTIVTEMKPDVNGYNEMANRMLPRTPLGAAVAMLWHERKMDIIKLLVDNGCNLQAKDANDKSHTNNPVGYALQFLNGGTDASEIKQFLLSRGGSGGGNLMTNTPSAGTTSSSSHQDSLHKPQGSYGGYPPGSPSGSSQSAPQISTPQYQSYPPPQSPTTPRQGSTPNIPSISPPPLNTTSSFAPSNYLPSGSNSSPALSSPTSPRNVPPQNSASPPLKTSGWTSTRPKSSNLSNVNLGALRASQSAGSGDSGLSSPQQQNFQQNSQQQQQQQQQQQYNNFNNQQPFFGSNYPQQQQQQQNSGGIGLSQQPQQQGGGLSQSGSFGLAGTSFSRLSISGSKNK